MKIYNLYLQVQNTYRSKRTVLNTETCVGKYIQRYNIQDLNDVTVSDCYEHLANLKAEGKQFSTINLHIRALRAFFTFAITSNIIEENVWTKVKFLKETTKEKAYLSDEECVAMLNNCKMKDDKAVLSLMLYAGLRRHEVCSLKRGDYKDGRMKIYNTKGKKDHTLLVFPKVCEILDTYLVGRDAKWGNNPEGALFIGRTGNPLLDEAVHDKVKNVAKRAGIDIERIKLISPHTFRHTFAANVVENNNLESAKLAMRHSSIFSTMKYLHIRPRAVDKIIMNQPDYL